jgi:hypothetical protein
VIARRAEVVAGLRIFWLPLVLSERLVLAGHRECYCEMVVWMEEAQMKKKLISRGSHHDTKGTEAKSV